MSRGAGYKIQKSIESGQHPHPDYLQEYQNNAAEVIGDKEFRKPEDILKTVKRIEQVYTSTGVAPTNVRPVERKGFWNLRFP